MAESGREIIIKKVKKREFHYTHGGQWKVAYADFVTAMMAFFLLLWLIAMISPEKRAVLAEYFKNFSIFQDSGTSVIEGKAFVMEDLITRPEIRPEEFGNKFKRAVEEKLKDMKDQVLVDVIEGGVRIQIVDKENRSMFDVGSAKLKPYTVEILREIATVINEVPNHISITGHTDARPYVRRDYGHVSASPRSAGQPPRGCISRSRARARWAGPDRGGRPAFAAAGDGRVRARRGAIARHARYSGGSWALVGLQVERVPPRNRQRVRCPLGASRRGGWRSSIRG